MVNDGAVPCQVQNLGGRQFRASFTPTDPVPHVVWMKFNGFAVPGRLLLIFIFTITEPCDNTTTATTNNKKRAPSHHHHHQSELVGDVAVPVSARQAVLF